MLVTVEEKLYPQPSSLKTSNVQLLYNSSCRYRSVKTKNVQFLHSVLLRFSPIYSCTLVHIYFSGKFEMPPSKVENEMWCDTIRVCAWQTSITINFSDPFYEIEIDLYSFNRKLREGTTEQLLFYFYMFYTTLQVFFRKFQLAPLAIRPLFQFSPFFELFGYGFVHCTCHCV